MEIRMGRAGQALLAKHKAPIASFFFCWQIEGQVDDLSSFMLSMHSSWPGQRLYSAQ